MEAYHAFASVYDRMMEEIPYEAWCDFVTGLLADQGITGGLMLELGCGTGTLTELFARKGFDMIGVDRSEEMLDEALTKRDESGLEILYLLQDMRSFELYGTVASVVSLCDSMNYITAYEDLVQVFRLVNNYLDPGGIFVFDLKTEHYFADVVGTRTFAEPDDEISYIWQNEYDRETRINRYLLTLFLQDGDTPELYERFDELHEQRAWKREEVLRAAAEAGMETVAVCNESGLDAGEDTERVYVLLREKGKKPQPVTCPV